MYYLMITRMTFLLWMSAMHIRLLTQLFYDANPLKKTKLEHRKRNAKKSVDLEELELIKEFHGEIIKQKEKEQFKFDSKSVFALLLQF